MTRCRTNLKSCLPMSNPDLMLFAGESSKFMQVPTSSVNHGSGQGAFSRARESCKPALSSTCVIVGQRVDHTLEMTVGAGCPLNSRIEDHFADLPLLQHAMTGGSLLAGDTPRPPDVTAHCGRLSV